MFLRTGTSNFYFANSINIYFSMLSELANVQNRANRITKPFRPYWQNKRRVYAHEEITFDENSGH